MRKCKLHPLIHLGLDFNVEQNFVGVKTRTLDEEEILPESAESVGYVGDRFLPPFLMRIL